MNLIPKTPRTTLKRLPERGSHERAEINRILDEGLYCHIGFVVENQPFVIPTSYGRWGDELLIHGSSASRMMRQLKTGLPCCVTVTLVDGLVLARSAFHHSMNYRSVILLGNATEITAEKEKLEAMRTLVEHITPGRWDSLRPVNETELKATTILQLPIEEASAKIRIGPPKDDEEDYALPIWAGVLPFSMRVGEPVADPLLSAGINVPPDVVDYQRPHNSRR